ncbi:unnamed protein product [Choristocarpus tenellus]
MSLEALIAKGKSSRPKAGNSGGKARTNGRGGRANRRQQSAPYSRAPTSPKISGSLGKRVFVGNLSFDVTWKELKDLMKQAGDVVKADVALDPSGRSKVSVVEFRTPAGARSAIDSLQNIDLMGRPIFLREDREAALVAPSRSGITMPARASTMGRGGGGFHGGRLGGGSNNCKVFCGNLAFEVQWQDLKDHMRQAGNVIHADVFVSADGRSKGCGVVEYSRPFEARAAISQLCDTELLGRPILVREDHGEGDRRGGGMNGGSAGARVYVGNISWDVAWQDLKDYMRQAGNVKYVDLFQEPNTGRSKGCALVEYERADEAHIAIRELNDTELMGRLIFVREDREEGIALNKGMGSIGGEQQLPAGGVYPGAEGRQVYVGNLSWECDWKELKDHFKQVGNVQFVEIPEDDQGRSKGYATVRYSSEQGADRAIRDLNESVLLGRRILVREDNR